MPYITFQNNLVALRMVLLMNHQQNIKKTISFIVQNFHCALIKRVVLENIRFAHILHLVISEQIHYFERFLFRQGI